MRDSIGGTMLFWIVLFLFSIFIIFIAFIIKYARVHKIKNNMVSYVEKNEGVDTRDNFEGMLLGSGYSDKSYKICRYMLPKGGYYTLELYSVTDFPVLGNYFAINITIKGETKVIKSGTKIKNTTDMRFWFNSTQDECYICTVNGSCENIKL